MRGIRGISRPRGSILAAGLLLAGMLAAPWACRPATRGDGDIPPRNLLLVSCDTTRDDVVGAVHGVPLTPHLDALAAAGRRYPRAYGTATWTLPSHASLLTGLYPSRHGAVASREEPYGHPLGTKPATLAAMLSRMGYRCGAVVSAPLLRRLFGLDRGFDTWRDDGFTSRRAGEETTRLALAWLGDPPAEPFFLFAHYFDAHGPYGDPQADPCPIEGHGEALEAWRGWTPRRRDTASRQPLATADREAVRHLYFEGVHRLDHAVGELIDGLVARGVWERTAVIVVGDHGEELGDQGIWGHGYKFPTEAQLRVPLILRVPRGWDLPHDPGASEGPPGTSPAGRPGETPPGDAVDLTAVVPSVAGLLGIPLPPELRDSPPLPGLEWPGEHPRGGPRVAASEAHWPAARRWTRCIHASGMAYAELRDVAGMTLQAWIDASPDPVRGRWTPLPASAAPPQPHPPPVRRMEAAMEAIDLRLPRDAAGLFPEEPPAAGDSSPEARKIGELLRQLGYGGG